MRPIPLLISLYDLNMLKMELPKYVKRGDPEDGDIIRYIEERIAALEYKRAVRKTEALLRGGSQ